MLVHRHLHGRDAGPIKACHPHAIWFNLYLCTVTFAGSLAGNLGATNWATWQMPGAILANGREFGDARAERRGPYRSGGGTLQCRCDKPGCLGHVELSEPVGYFLLGVAFTRQARLLPPSDRGAWLRETCAWRQQSTGFATDRPSRSLSRQSGVDTQFRLDDHALGYRAPSWISEVGCGVRSGTLRGGIP